MLHESSEIRKSNEIFFPRPHKSFKKYSKAISNPSSLWSISSLCLDIVRKHLEGILRTYEKSFEFPEKNNNFVKKIKALLFQIYFPPQQFFSVTKEPKNHKKLLAEPKRSTSQCFNFFTNCLIIFRISYNVLKTINWSYLGQKAHFWTTVHTFFLSIYKVGENKVTLFLSVLNYFPKYGHFSDFT